MITHLEPDILECEVKWALGSITTNKAGGGYGNPVEVFQILKDDAVKMLLSSHGQMWLIKTLDRNFHTISLSVAVITLLHNVNPEIPYF